MKINLKNTEKFETRHIAPDSTQIAAMLKTIGVDAIETLIKQIIPKNILLEENLKLPPAQTEYDFLRNLKKIAQKNKIHKNYIGTGYHECITPGVILRNVLENPNWYTAYTPYQAEIAQGRLEALINFQTVIIELTGMEIANASLLDEGTAAAEAMAMLYNLRKNTKKDAHVFFVSELCHPQTIDILKSRAEPIGIELKIGDHTKLDPNEATIFGMLLQYPATDGEVYDYTDLIAQAHAKDITVAVAADLLSLTLLKPPGEMDADVVVGSAQRFGVPMGCGGPHAAFFATKDVYKRNMPGRIIGVSVDAQGKKAYRMALQTREQHIRREKATSNICTAQVLLAVIASFYAVYHGPTGLRNIGQRVYGLTRLLALGLEKVGVSILNANYFDTLKVYVVTQENKNKVKALAEQKELNFRYFEGNYIGISIAETTSLEAIQEIIDLFKEATESHTSFNIKEEEDKISIALPENLHRKSDYLTHPVFNSYHAEHELLRYIKSLEDKDLTLTHSMIPLGSCTMKLNAAAEMIPLTWPEFGNIHPFAPADQIKGYLQIFEELENWLVEITGFSKVSLQPNSGAQGEFAGLMVIKAYHEHRNQGHRNIALIPSSAHGTNPASAVMAGMHVVVVNCDKSGNIDVVDLKEKLATHADKLSCLMVTYPSTHGVFEDQIKDICSLVHEKGGLVYMDGANLNAQVGLTSPGKIGADVCHMNLHKTFCIPHGGGGPGMGPIGVVAHLAPFLPSHALVKVGGEKGIHAISAAPWGSASILTISYAYIAMMGADGLKKATETAILNANYMKAVLEKHYPILYSGNEGRVAHEMIVDCRAFKEIGIEVEDIAKRLMDYGFHAPTVSFPVAGTLMIEPTESESKEELDKFCDAMIAIREEIKEVAAGKYERQSNVLKNAPHTLAIVSADEWAYAYTREKAAFPLKYVRNHKFWPTVGRIDSAYGDRNLVCSCIPIEMYSEDAQEKQAEMAS